jgi:hypothetical protein
MRARGVTLLEGMIAAAVFAIGVVGMLSGIMLASMQNILASRLTVASGISKQVRAGLEWQGYGQLVRAGGLLDSTRCSSDPKVKSLGAGLGELSAQSCVIDLDAFEADPVNSGNLIVSGYSSTLKASYRRVIVWQRDATQVLAPVVVVVSFRDALGRRFVRQSAALYNPQKNQAKVSL